MTMIELRGVMAKGGKDIQALAEYDRNLRELATYRATGLTPEQIQDMIKRQDDEEAPLPLL